MGIPNSDRIMLRTFARLCTTRVAAAGTWVPRVAAVSGGTVSCLVGAASFSSECEVPHVGVPGTDKERTFIAVKPDGVQRGIISDIIARFEKRGYKLVAMKMVWPTPKWLQSTTQISRPR